MSSYKVTSDRLAGHDRGATVTADDLEGVNVDALLQGGHLAEQKKGKADKSAESDG
jgi:hypothetical protein